MELNQELLRTLGERYDSFYLYDEGELLCRLRALKRAFPSVTFLYSAKANPHSQILKTVFSQGFGVDAASPAEVRMGAERGLSPAYIHFSAPGKTEQGIRETLSCATIVADSENEVERIQRIAAEEGRQVEIGLRIHPAFTLGNSVRCPSKFGIEEERVLACIPKWKHLPNIKITGIHVHLKSQLLDETALTDYYGEMLALAERVSEALGQALRFVNLGSGIGIPYAEGDTPLNLSTLGERGEALFRAFRQKHPDTRLLLETGRYVVGLAGVYGTRVLDKKTSCGETFVLLCNTLNGFLRPSLARLIEGYAETPASCEPLYTGQNAIRIIPLSQRQEWERVTLAGNLCTAADTVAEGIFLPRLEPGDLVLFPNAGSYAAVLSPVQFSSQTPPKQLFLTEKGTLLE